MRKTHFVSTCTVPYGALVQHSTRHSSRSGVISHRCAASAGPVTAAAGEHRGLRHCGCAPNLYILGGPVHSRHQPSITAVGQGPCRCPCAWAPAQPDHGHTGDGHTGGGSMAGLAEASRIGWRDDVVAMHGDRPPAPRAHAALVAGSTTSRPAATMFPPQQHSRRHGALAGTSDHCNVADPPMPLRREYMQELPPAFVSSALQGAQRVTAHVIADNVSIGYLLLKTECPRVYGTLARQQAVMKPIAYASSARHRLGGRWWLPGVPSGWSHGYGHRTRPTSE